MAIIKMKRVRSIERSIVQFSKRHPIVWAVAIFILGGILIGVLREFGTDAYNNVKDWYISVYAEPLLPGSRLEEETISLYEDIMTFVKEREVSEPSIDFDKWEESTDMLIKYSRETMGLYDVKFGSRVVAIREEYLKLGIRSDRLDQFYEHPTNPLGIREVALGLAELAAELSTTSD